MCVRCGGYTELGFCALGLDHGTEWSTSGDDLELLL